MSEGVAWPVRCVCGQEYSEERWAGIAEVARDVRACVCGLHIALKVPEKTRVVAFALVELEVSAMQPQAAGTCTNPKCDGGYGRAPFGTLKPGVSLTCVSCGSACVYDGPDREAEIALARKALLSQLEPAN